MLCLRADISAASVHESEWTVIATGIRDSESESSTG
jgi:hypothetical protein